MPQLNFTERQIAALEAPHYDGKQTLYWDTNVKGFGVQVSGISNVKSYVVKGRLRGRTVRITIERTNVLSLAGAKQEARAILADLGAGLDPRRRGGADITLGDALKSYLAGHDLRPRTKEAYQSTVSLYFPDWVNVRLRDIDRTMIAARHQKIVRDVAKKHADLAWQHRRDHISRAEKADEKWPEVAERHRQKAAAAANQVPFTGRTAATFAMRVLRALYAHARDWMADDLPERIP